MENFNKRGNRRMKNHLESYNRMFPWNREDLSLGAIGLICKKLFSSEDFKTIFRAVNDPRKHTYLIELTQAGLITKEDIK